MTGFAWTARSPEERALLNPAFCGGLLLSAAMEFGEQGLPFPLVFLVLPLVLHKKSREALPSTIRTSVPTWLQRHPEVKVGFDQRVRQTVPIAREALAFLLAHKKLHVGAGGALLADAAIKLDHDPGSDEVKDCLTKARFIGRWLRRAGTAPTLYALFGIRP